MERAEAEPLQDSYERTEEWEEWEEWAEWANGEGRGRKEQAGRQAGRQADSENLVGCFGLLAF